MPVSAMLVIVSGAVPVLVNVTACEVVVTPIMEFPNVRLVGLKVTAGTGGVTPVPDNVVLSGLDDALVVKVNEADLAPSVVGVKVTLTTQLLPIAKLVPQGLLEIAKSPAFAPVSAMLVIVTADGPVFVSVTVCGALVTLKPVLP